MSISIGTCKLNEFNSATNSNSRSKNIVPQARRRPSGTMVLRSNNTRVQKRTSVQPRNTLYTPEHLRALNIGPRLQVNPPLLPTVEAIHIHILGREATETMTFSGRGGERSSHNKDTFIYVGIHTMHRYWSVRCLFEW